MHRLFIHAILAASWFALGSPRAGAQGLTNGSFESNGGQGSTTGPGWTFLNNAGYVNTEGATDGSFAAVFNRGTLVNNGTVYQTVTGLLTGHVYQVSFDYGGEGTLLAQQLGVNVRNGSAYNAGSMLIDSGSATINATSGGSIVANGASLVVADTTPTAASGRPAGSNPEFNQVSFDFTAQGDTATLVFSDVGTLTLTSDLVMDNVALTAAVPEPTTAVGGAALAGLAFFLCLRRFWVLRGDAPSGEP